MLIHPSTHHTDETGEIYLFSSKQLCISSPERQMINCTYSALNDEDGWLYVQYFGLGRLPVGYIAFLQTIFYPCYKDLSYSFCTDSCLLRRVT
jgi:hypothetical protein